METSLITLLATVCLFGIGASLDTDDILSNVFTGVGTNNAVNNRNDAGNQQMNNGYDNGGGMMVNLNNPSAGGLGGLGNLGGVYGSNYGGYLDDYDHDHDERQMSSVADLVNVIFGLGGHVVGRAGWIVRDALGALANVGSLLTHSLDMGMTSAAMVKKFLSPGLKNKLSALSMGTRLMYDAKMIKELKKPLRGKLFNGHLLNALLNKSMVTSLPARLLLGDLLPRSRDGMLYSNHRLSDDEFGLRNRALGGLRGYGGGMYGTSYPSYYQRFSSHRNDDK